MSLFSVDHRHVKIKMIKYFLNKKHLTHKILLSSKDKPFLRNHRCQTLTKHLSKLAFTIALKCLAKKKVAASQIFAYLSEVFDQEEYTFYGVNIILKI